ncbi:hypothetical protein BUALT_Bualt02G0067800 [Buddleja alternifolia]|uniref:Leucine-rich repeat-containing N-terminal plant-type domain-containing protein n=1 Tax=Buddleja alternifolia TaxID=168488 RepID=A0AAV6Y075_9LAMI|nr:hypothetical protein BUALT_Bualt02G0067800 [Buddleja alternifolia]
MDFLPSLAWLLLLLFMIKVMFPMQSDVDCVRSMKESLQDPLDKLTTWQFNDIRAETQYDNYICSFNGVECWNSSEGRIPQQLVTLVRMTTFTVANNLLSGPVPAFAFSMFPRDIYANNGGLCGYPLDPCESGGRDPFVSGLIAGWAVFCALFFVVGWFCNQIHSDDHSKTSIASFEQ